MTTVRTIHGARSELRVKAVATVQKRRMLRRIGLRVADLDGIGAGYLDLWARAQAKVELMDAYSAEHGWLDTDGNPPGFTKTYFAAVNSARLALNEFQTHLKATTGKRVPMDLSQYRHERGKGA